MATQGPLLAAPPACDVGHVHAGGDEETLLLCKHCVANTQKGSALLASSSDVSCLGELRQAESFI